MEISETDQMGWLTVRSKSDKNAYACLCLCLLLMHTSLCCHYPTFAVDLEFWQLTCGELAMVELIGVWNVHCSVLTKKQKELKKHGAWSLTTINFQK